MERDLLSQTDDDSSLEKKAKLTNGAKMKGKH